MAKLLDGEREIMPSLHRHWIILARALALPLAISVVLVTLAVVVPFVPAGARLLVALVVLAVLGAWMIGAYLEWAAAALTLTDQRVILEEGIFSRSTKVISLDRVQDVLTTQSLLGRLLNYGKVEIDAAGASGREVFEYVQGPEILRDQVFVLSEQLRRSI